MVDSAVPVAVVVVGALGAGWARVVSSRGRRGRRGPAVLPIPVRVDQRAPRRPR